MKIRILKSREYSGILNMGIDEMLFLSYNEEKPPVMRFYTWEIPTLSMGYFQSSKRFHSLKERDDVAIVRRMTGGRGVIHHLELTYSLVGGYDDVFASLDLQGTYGAISRIFQSAFSSLGIDMEISGGEQRSSSENCFDSPSLYEITIKGHKVIGSAQYRSKGKFLQHGSVILDVDYPLWSDIYGLPEESMRASVKGINELTGRELTAEVIQNSVVSALSPAFAAESSALSKEELAQAQELAFGKYSDTEFTFRR
ncbi:lipoate--protein ligase family protein [bacterium]|nr:lipoate--protein ligase family protein [bacterium]